MQPKQYVEILLQPGEYYFSNDPNTRIRTLLGSCVSVTLWHPKLKTGGMCHFLLPKRKHSLEELNIQQADARYAEEALWLLQQEVKQAGLPLSQFQAKLFGGGRMFNHEAGSISDVGYKNIQMAKDLLHKMGLHSISEHVGGTGHRNVFFDLWNGDVWVRQLPLQPKK
ncbi:MAG: chemotaxis protein CheD [Pararheinheimera sp.]|nr:chemotaxis protein CheD [Rheinheimera sp.]